MAFLGNLVGILALVCTIWVIYDVLAKNKQLSTVAKVIWIVCALLFSIVTAIIYFFIGRNKQIY
jgi:hypothetical protein